MTIATRVLVASSLVFILGACASTSGDGWSKTVENKYSFSGEAPDGFGGEKPEVALPIQAQVERVRRGLSDRAKYVLAQQPNPPQPCRERPFTYRFLKPGFGTVIHQGRARTDDAGILRVPLPAKVREQGSQGLGVDLEVVAVLSIGRTEGQIHPTSELSEPRVRFGGGYLVAIPAKALSDLWLRFGDRDL